MADKANITASNAAKAPAKAVSGTASAPAAQAAAEPSKAAHAAAQAAPEAAGNKGTAQQAALILSEEVAAEIWEAIAPGHVVLMAEHVDGVFEGWWPARVLSRDGGKATLNWLGHEQMGTFTKPVINLALMTTPASSRRRRGNSATPWLSGESWKH